LNSINKPDLIRVWHDKKEKTFLLIDIAISNDKNINTTEPEKLSDNKDLDIEDSRMWKVRTKIVSVTIRALGTIKTGLN
jgi:hypothetical protein